jgi:ribosomal-protein-alanine N-acetyltransferase
MNLSENRDRRVVAAVPNTIVTNRLLLRPFEPGDTEAAFGWFGDPTVMRFTPAGPDKSVDDTKVRLAKYQEHQAVHGFSKWIIVDRDTSRPIGDAGLLVLQDYDWIDFGYRLAQPYWGNGLATEAGSGWVRAAFDQFQIDRLTAFVHPENVASIRVLHKLGFGAGRQGTVMGMKSILYSLVCDSRSVSD